MARKFLSNTGWVVVEMNTIECFQALPGTLMICDHSNEYISGKAYYVPVLNHLLNENSFNEWNDTAKYYPEDVPYETRNYEFVSSRIKITEK